MGRVVIPGFRKIETSSGEGGTTNYNDLTNKPSINNVPLVGNLNTVDLKLTDATLTEEGVPAEAKTVGTKLEEHSSSLIALSEQLGNHTVKSDVPENAVFTDTVYDDTEVQKRISDNGYGEVAGGKNLLNHNIIDSKMINCSVLFKNDTFYATNKGSFSNFILSVPTIVGKSYTVTIKDWSDYSYRCIASVSDLNDNTLVSKVITDATLSMTFTAVGTESLIQISPNNTLDEMSNTITFKCMLEEGLVATEYEPYFPSNKMLEEENSQKSTEMMDIKMLGWSVPIECPIQNEVNGNQFIQKVGRVDLGNYDYSRYEQKGFFAKIIGIKNVPDRQTLPNIYCKGYRTVTSDDTWVDGDISMTPDVDEYVYIMDTSYTDAATFKQAMQGQYLYYELATYNTITIDGNEIGETVSDVRKETTVNLLNLTLQTTTQNGVTCTNNGDGTYTLNGTATNNFSEYITTLFGLSQNKSYKLLGTPIGGSTQTYSITLLSEDFSDYVDDIGEGVIITPKKSSYLARLNIVKGTTVNNLVFKPILTTNLNATIDDFVGCTGSTGSLNGDVADIRKDIKTLEKYNTTETVIGKWDDYTLCRKVISGNYSITAGKEFSFLVDTITSDEGVVMEIKNIRGRAKGSVIYEGNKDVDGVMAVGSYCNANYYCSCFMPASSPDSISLLGKFGNSVNYVEVELCVEYTVERI